MKKVIGLMSVLFLVGCGNKEMMFSRYARDYYESYMRDSNDDFIVITLDDLYDSSIESDYDLDMFKKCDRTSKITFFLDKSTNLIKNEKIELNC